MLNSLVGYINDKTRSSNFGRIKLDYDLYSQEVVELCASYFSTSINIGTHKLDVADLYINSNAKPEDISTGKTDVLLGRGGRYKDQPFLVYRNNKLENNKEVYGLIKNIICKVAKYIVNTQYDNLGPAEKEDKIREILYNHIDHLYYKFV